MKRIKNFLLTIMITVLLSFATAFKPVADPTYTVKSTEWFVDGANMAPGTTIYIPAGTRGALLLKNLKGTPEKPITVVNKGGKAILTTASTASYGLKTQNCRYFKILGNGDPSTKYGIDVNGGNISVTMDNLSSDFEVAYLEVHNSGFAGIMAKTDPSCDVTTQRGNFVMANVIVQYNYVHNTGGEGLYIGNSFYSSGSKLSCGTVLPHEVKNLKVCYNIVDSTGCEGIQVGSATVQCQVFSNTVTSSGLSPFANGQNNGIQIGEGTGGKCYNNLVKNSPGNGIIVLGLGDNLVYNNVIINSGTAGAGSGIFADSRYTPGPYFMFINNTIINSKDDGLRLYSQTIPMHYVINNVIVNSGSGKDVRTLNTAVKVTTLNNYSNKDINTVKFVDFNKGNYKLQSASPVINKGLDVTVYGVTFDYFSKGRSTGTFDIGATEY